MATGTDDPAPTTTTTTTAATVQAPKFGGNYPGSPTVVWVGGPPLDDFSGSFLPIYQSPLAIRGLSPESEIKGYAKRVLDGHPTKFKRDDPDFSLMAFAEEALSHMQTTGMDTVFYMKGVDINGNGGEELFTYHSKYTKSSVSAAIDNRIAAGLFDEYAKTALKESAQWLVNSLDESLKSSLRPQLASRPSGPVLWMMIVAEVQADSLRRCKLLADEFRALSLAKFKGENVRDYAKAADSLLLQLERDDQLPSTHLLDIVDHLSACSIMDFKIHFMTQRSKVEAFVKETLGKDKAAIASLPDRIHFRDLLEDAKEKYTNLQHLWGKSSQSKEQALLSQVKALQAKLDKVDQQLKAQPSENKPKGKRACFNCGSEDHLANQCDKPKKANNNTNNGTQNKGKGTKSANSGTPGKWAKPKDGEPTEKEIDGEMRYYCTKCNNGKGRWTKNHKTDGHKTKEQLDAAKETTPAAKLASLNICQDLHSTWFE